MSQKVKIEFELENGDYCTGCPVAPRPNDDSGLCILYGLVDWSNGMYIRSERCKIDNNTI